MCSSHRNAFAGGTLTGNVELRDDRSWRCESKLNAHTGPLKEMMLKGDLLITCGLMQRPSFSYSNLRLDPLLRIFDIRPFRPLPPFAYPAPPPPISFIRNIR